MKRPANNGMYIALREVEARAEHHLFLKFGTGASTTVDFRPLLTRKAFEKLRDPKLFAKAFVQHGTVAWPGDIDLAPEGLDALIRGTSGGRARTAPRAKDGGMTLRELRAHAGGTQAGLAETLGMDQGQLSRFERADDRLVSTLRRYLEALGGELEIVAVVGGKRVPLRGV